MFVSNIFFAQVLCVFSADSIHAQGIKAFQEYLQKRFQSQPEQKRTGLHADRHFLGKSRTETFSITQNYFLDSIQMYGTLDGQNTFTRLSRFNRLENEYFQFVPMESISIVNKGTTPIHAPRFIINKERNWWNTKNFLSEAMEESERGELTQNMVLYLWDFLKRNREHYSPSGYDGMNSINMFTIYGYSTCDIVAFVSRLLAWYYGNTGYSYLMPHHTVTELSDGVRSFVVDTDLEVFYLGFDNKTLVGIGEVTADRFLIRRTKHFGRNIIYDKEIDAWVGLIYSLGYRNQPPMGYPSSSFDFLLRPGESILFNYGRASLYYHNWLDNTTIPDSFLDYFISNSKFTLSTNFDSIAFKSIFEESNNILFSQKGSGRPAIYAEAGGSAYFIYRMDSPFPLLDAHLKGVFYSQTENDSICIFLSLDGETTWKRIWTSSNIGTHEDSIHIGRYFPIPLPSMSTIPPYSYSLKFVLNSSDSSISGLDSIYIENTFQIAQRFLPTLRLGNNLISYQDANGDDSTRNVEITVRWIESSENTPPNRPAAPVFPLHQASVDSLYFAFKWEPATDDDGDEIVDYEFFLSRDSCMRFPHSPNFNLFVSTFGEDSIRPRFKVKETGWLNHGETYYWRVRARDVRGAWSEWSDTWSFTPHGVMRPINGKAEIIGQSIKLSWERNPIGNQPNYYVIYASNETNGFSPSEQTFFAFADSTSLIIPFDKNVAPFSFFRIAARDTFGQESLISNVIAIPYPHMYAAFDSVRPGSMFSMNLFSNTRFYPYFYFEYREILYIPVITVKQKPDWLNYDSTAGILYSNDTTIARWLVYQDSSQRTIVLSLDDGLGGVAAQTIFLQIAGVKQKSSAQPAIAVSSVVSVFPNPTDGIFTLQFETSGTYFVTLTDITGRILLQQSVNGQTTQMDISLFSVGLYFLNVNDGQQGHTLRIMKY